MIISILLNNLGADDPLKGIQQLGNFNYQLLYNYLLHK